MAKSNEEVGLAERFVLWGPSSGACKDAPTPEVGRRQNASQAAGRPERSSAKGIADGAVPPALVQYSVRAPVLAGLPTPRDLVQVLRDGHCWAPPTGRAEGPAPTRPCEFSIRAPR